MPITFRFVATTILIASLSGCESDTDWTAPSRCWSDDTKSTLFELEGKVDAIAFFRSNPNKRDNDQQPSDAFIEKVRNKFQYKANDFYQVSYDPTSKVHVCSANITIAYKFPKKTFTVGPYPVKFTLLPAENNGFAMKIANESLESPELVDLTKQMAESNTNLAEFYE